MPSEGKVGSLFVEFRTNLNQFVSDMQRMANEVRSFDATVSSASKRFSDLGHLGSTAISEVVHDFGGLTSGLSTVNTFTQQVSRSFSDLGHIGSAAVIQISDDLGGLTSGIGTVNTFAKQAAGGFADLGHLGSPAIKGVVDDLGGLTSGINTVNTFARQASTGLGDMGHLGSPAIRGVSSDLGGLTSGLSTVNTFTRQASTGISDLGHLGSMAMGGAAAATASFGDRIRQASVEMRQFDRAFGPIQRRLNEVGFALTAGITVPLAAAAAFVFKVGTDFETAFSGVRQTLNASEDELAALRRQLIDLSTTAPTTAAEFANIATTAAKLGVEAPNIAKFASTMNELAAVTNLSGEAAANFLARFSNVTHLPQDQIHNLGATLFALGKAFPAVESEIANFGLRLAKTGTFVGLTSGQILAFATALSSVGVTAELGGTAISAVLASMAKASEKLDSAKLAQFAVVAGQTAKQFAESFKTDAAGAVLDFVRGLQRIKDEGGNVFSTLDALQLGNRRTLETLLAMAAGSDEFARALGIQGNQVQSNADFTRAYGEKLKTTQNQIEIFKNQVDALGISLFNAIGPVINSQVLPALKRLIDEGIRPAIAAFESMSPSAQHVVEAILLFAAATGPAILAITKLVSFVSGLKIIFDALKLEDAGIGMASLGNAASKLIAPLTAVGIVIGGWELENVVVNALGLQKQFDELKASAIELGKAVVNLAGAFGQFAIKEIENDWKNFKATVDTLVGPIRQIATAIILIQFVRSGAEIKALTGFLNDLSKTMDGTVVSSNSLTAAMARVMTASTNSLPDAMARVMAADKLSRENTGTGHIGPTVEEIAAQAEAAAKLAKEHANLISKFTEELIPATILGKKLDDLLGDFSEEEVVAVYAKQIVDATEAQQDHGIAVTGTIAKLYEQAKAFENLRQKVKDLLKEKIEPVTLPVGTLPGPETSPIELKALTNFDNAKKQINDLAITIKNLSFLGPDAEIRLLGKDLDEAAKLANEFQLDLGPSVQALIDQKKAAEDAAAGLKTYNDAVNIGMKTADDMAQQIDVANKNILKMQDAGFADAQILDILGSMIDTAAKNARILGVELDPATAALKKMRDEMNKTAEEAKGLAKIMNKVTAEIVNDLANGIADALIGSKSLADLGTKLAKDFAEAFIKAAVSEIAASLTAKLQALMKSHPVVAAVAAAVLVVVDIVKLLGNTHLFANQFVQQTQNPFAKSLSQFVATSDKLYAAGRQTYEGAQQAETKVQELWQGFLDDAAKFGQQGRKQATVAQQAIEELTPTFTRVIFGIQQQIESLKPPSVRAIESVQGLGAYQAAIAANTAEHIAELQAEASAIDEQIHFVMTQIDAQDELGGSTKELNAQLQELIYQWDAVQDALNPVVPNLYSFAEAVNSVSGSLAPDKTQAFLDQVLNATGGAANLEQALGILEEIKTPAAIILDRLGGDIQNFANALTESGLPVPELISKYLALGQAQKNLSNSISDTPRIANSLSKLVGGAVDKLREIANGADLSQAILDALTRLLTGLPSPVRPAIGETPGLGGVGAVTPVTQQIIINVNDNEVINNEILFTDEISREAVRDDVIPEITEALTNNTDSVREKWVKILRAAGVGVSQ